MYLFWLQLVTLFCMCGGGGGGEEGIDTSMFNKLFWPTILQFDIHIILAYCMNHILSNLSI